MPPIQNSAWQTFYGTLPLILVLCGIYFRDARFTKDMLQRLTNLEKSVSEMKESLNSQFREVRTDLSAIRERLVALEMKAGLYVAPTNR